MSKVQFAVGWLREFTDKKTGETQEYISAVTGGDRKNPVKLLVEDQAGNQHVVENFAVFFSPPGENPKAPQVSFTATLKD
jgi:hypothetical protein